jgi:hypothetical protein
MSVPFPCSTACRLLHDQISWPCFRSTPDLSTPTGWDDAATADDDDAAADDDDDDDNCGCDATCTERVGAAAATVALLVVAAVATAGAVVTGTLGNGRDCSVFSCCC